MHNECFTSKNDLDFESFVVSFNFDYNILDLNHIKLRKTLNFEVFQMLISNFMSKVFDDFS